MRFARVSGTIDYVGRIDRHTGSRIESINDIGRFVIDEDDRSDVTVGIKTVGPRKRLIARAATSYSKETYVGRRNLAARTTIVVESNAWKPDPSPTCAMILRRR